MSGSTKVMSVTRLGIWASVAMVVFGCGGSTSVVPPTDDTAVQASAFYLLPSERTVLPDGSRLYVELVPESDGTFSGRAERYSGSDENPAVQEFGVSTVELGVDQSARLDLHPVGTDTDAPGDWFIEGQVQNGAIQHGHVFESVGEGQLEDEGDLSFEPEAVDRAEEQWLQGFSADPDFVHWSVSRDRVTQADMSGDLNASVSWKGGPRNAYFLGGQIFQPEVWVWKHSGEKLAVCDFWWHGSVWAYTELQPITQTSQRKVLQWSPNPRGVWTGLPASNWCDVKERFVLNLN